MKNQEFYNFNMWMIVISLLLLIAVSLLYIAFFRNETPHKKRTTLSD